MNFHDGRDNLRARSDWFTYEQRFPRVGIAPSIMSEPGVRGGNYPTVECEIDSVVARHLRSAGQESIAEDLQPFALTVLHFRRTFVEKLFIVHGLAERLQHEGQGLGRNARHYIDLHALASEPEVEVMLRSQEYQQIKEDYEALSLQFFKKRYVRPSDLSFAQSPGVFPSESLRARIVADYDEQCRTLCYGAYPSFDDVVGRFETLRELL
jgi:Nucleotidyl transferase AbiEii toxin, Type IV TA system